MTFTSAARNFTFLMVVAFVLLIVDLYKWQTGKQTWSEAIWTVNQKTLSFSFGVGVVCGHLLTVPRGRINARS
jgi:uncharacterized membrane protein YoaK (UPF0700 family)